MSARAEAKPVFSPAGPDAAAYGEAQNYPASPSVVKVERFQQVGSSTDWDTRFPAHHVSHAAKVWNFRRAALEADVHFELSRKPASLSNFLARVPVTGLLLVKDDTILFEHYQYARTDKHRLLGNSMTKTIVSMLMGIAIADGRIHSVQDKAADYVPELKGSLYGDTTLRVLLQMSSGITGDDPIAPDSKQTYGDRFFDELFTKGANPGTSLAKFYRRYAPTGEHFRYSSTDNETLTTVLHRAVKKPLADYLSEKIWRPIGAESDASWAADSSDQEIGDFGFSAVLRDYARFGRLLARDGDWDGRQIIPRQWILDATTLHPGDKQVAPGAAAYYYGYGYQLWILPDEPREFALIGAGGQYIFVDPKAKLVMVQTAVRDDSVKVTSPRNETLALWLAFVHDFSN